MLLRSSGVASSSARLEQAAASSAGVRAVPHSPVVEQQRWQHLQRRQRRASMTVVPQAASTTTATTGLDGSGPLGGRGSPQLLQQQEEEQQQEEQDDDVLIEFKDVHKAFGDKKILRGASFKIRRGEAVGIIGASGTGKSTTLRIAAGLLAPDRGEVLIQGKERVGLLSDQEGGLEAEHLKVGMVFQNAALFDSLTVGENVGFLLYEHSDLPEPKIKELVADSLAKVGLPGVEQLYPAELSGGMKKRVALARAVVTDVRDDRSEQVIMYDEPTAGLDPVASTVVEDLMRSLHATAGHGASVPRKGLSSYIVVTHQHSTIRRAVDRIIFLHKGKVVWEGSVQEFDTTAEPIVRQFAEGSLNGPIQYL